MMYYTVHVIHHSLLRASQYNVLLLIGVRASIYFTITLKFDARISI